MKQFFSVILLLVTGALGALPHIATPAQIIAPVPIIRNVNIATGAYVLDVGSAFAIVGGEVPGDSVVGRNPAVLYRQRVQSLVSPLEISVHQDRGNYSLSMRYPHFRLVPLTANGTDRWVFSRSGETRFRLLTYDRRASIYRLYYLGVNDRSFLEFNSAGYLVASVDDMRRTSIVYRRGKISSLTDPFGNVTSYEYTRGGGVRLTLGDKIFEYRFDREGRLSGIFQLLGPRNERSLFSFAYSNLIAPSGRRKYCGGLLASFKSELTFAGIAFEYARCDVFRMSATQDLSVTAVRASSGPLPMGPRTEFRYDSEAEVRVANHASVDRYVFEGSTSPLGRLVEIVSGNERRTIAYPDSNSLLPSGETAVIGQGRFSRTYVRNSLGQPTEIRNGSSVDQRFDCNSIGQVTRSSNSLGQQDQYSYDEAFKLTRMVVGNDTIQIGYDTNGYINSIEKNGVSVETRENNDKGQPVSITDPSTGATTFQYAADPDGLRGVLVQIADPAGNVTQTNVTSRNTGNTYMTNTSFGLGGTTIQTYLATNVLGMPTDTFHSWGPRTTWETAQSANSSVTHIRRTELGDGNTLTTNIVYGAGGEARVSATLNSATVMEGSFSTDLDPLR